VTGSSEVINPPTAPVAPTPMKSPMKSRLPRPSLAPSMAPPAKESRTTIIGPPTMKSLKKPMIPTQGNATTGQEAPAPKKNAFDVIMEAQRPQTLDKGKAKTKAKVTKVSAPSIFVKSREQHNAGPSTKSKMRLKEKMRPREKTKPKVPKFDPLSDEGEEEPGANWFYRAEPKEEMADTRPTTLSPEPSEFARTEQEVDVQPARASLECLETTPVVEDSVMKSAEEDHAAAPMPAFVGLDTSMAEAEILVQQKGDEPRPAAPEPSQEPPRPVVDDAITKEEANAPEPKDPVGESAAEVVETKESLAAEPTARPSARASNLPLGRKRQPICVEPADRVTRSASNSKKIGEVLGSTDGLSRSKSTTMSRLPAKRTASGGVKKSAPPAEATPLAKPEVAAETTLPPGSPMKLSSPDKTSDKGSPMRKGGTEVVQVMNSKFSAEKLASRPSPSKIARASSYMSMRPPGKLLQLPILTSLLIRRPVSPGVVRTFSKDTSLVRSGASASLSTLSNALEKLRMPPPSRPNTSMGFNRELSGDDDQPEPLARTQDDGKVGRISLGLGRTGGGVKRAATLGAGAFKTPTASTSTASAAAPSSKTAAGNGPVQKTLAMFMSSKSAGGLKTGNRSIILASGRPGIGNNNKASIFGGIGAGARRTISKRTPLPMVLGSPVKGGQGTDETMVDDNEAGEYAKTNATGEEASDNNFMAPANISTATVLAEDPVATEGSGKGKQKETRPDVSRRVSSLSYALSRSVSALPTATPPTKGLMGPPATPPSVNSNRSTGSNASGGNSASPSQAGPSGATRSSARIAKSAPALAKVKAGTDADAASLLTPSPETRKILDGCVIFVDVKTEDGDEAGSVFVKMLEDLGGRVSLNPFFFCSQPLSEIPLFSVPRERWAKLHSYRVQEWSCGHLDKIQVTSSLLGMFLNI